LHYYYYYYLFGNVSWIINMKAYNHWKNVNYIFYVHQDFIQSFSSSHWIKMNFEFQNVVMQIFKFFVFVYDNQRMSSKFQLIVYHDICYTSFFWVKSGSPLMSFHPIVQKLHLVICQRKYPDPIIIPYVCSWWL
jgi:hypothetical protein